MKKLMFIFLIIFPTVSFAQKVITYHDTIFEISQPYIPETIVIGYTPTHEYNTGDVGKDYQEFSEVVLFIYSLGINVIDVCKEDGLIMMVLNEKWQDRNALINEINKTYSGTCYYNILNDSFYGSSCEGRMKKDK